jgi:site-specific DNA-cytosine methylase
MVGRALCHTGILGTELVCAALRGVLHRHCAILLMCALAGAVHNHNHNHHNHNQLNATDYSPRAFALFAAAALCCSPPQTSRQRARKRRMVPAELKRHLQ